jgi:histidine kinase
MSIKLRLLLSNIAMIIIPIILFIAASLILTIMFLGDFREIEAFLPESHNYHKTVQQDTLLFYKLKEKAAMNPKELMNSDYLGTIEEELKDINADLIIRKGNEVFYSSRALKNVKLAELPDFGIESSVRNLEHVGEKTFAIKQHDFYLNDGSKVSLFLMKDASPLNKFVRTFFPILIGLCLVILVLTNGLLTYFMSKSIIKPINRLQEAAQSIKNGNLDHSITPIRNDEMGHLTEDFEEMRLRLKDSFETQRQYEVNRKELLAHISHDLKTPITSIKGYIEGIRDGVADTPEKKERYLQTVYSKAIDMDHLINDLFLFSKLDLGKVPFQFEKVNIKDYLEDYLEELQFDVSEMNVGIAFQAMPQGNYLIKMDREKFKRVLGNIVENSVKYMDKQTKQLTFALSTEEGMVNLSITDNGPGIQEEALPHIFQQFYRAEQSRNKATGGSGLGLSIAKMIVEEHKGSIEVESRKNNGTSITIKLPQEIEEKVVSA